MMIKGKIHMTSQINKGICAYQFVGLCGRGVALYISKQVNNQYEVFSKFYMIRYFYFEVVMCAYNLYYLLVFTSHHNVLVSSSSSIHSQRKCETGKKMKRRNIYCNQTF